MNIQCPQCDTLYDVSEEIKNSGAQVQCAKCHDIFTATPAPESIEAPEIVLESIAPPELEPQPDTEGSSELLSAEEKDFFTSFGKKLAAEEEAASSKESTEKQSPAEVALEAEAVESANPPAQEIEEDDIGWSQEEPDPQAAPDPEAADPFAELNALQDAVSFEETEPSKEIDLFGDADLSSEPDPVFEPKEEEPIVLQEAETIDKPAPASPAQNAKAALFSPTLIGWGALAASICLIIGGATLFRVPIVKAVPGMAGLYDKIGLPVNIRGLEFVGLNHQWMNKNGRMRLVVRGEIVNITDDAKPVPEIIFSMLDKRGLEFFQWTERTGLTSLQAGSRTRFRAQIPAPADRSRQLKIRFAKR